MSKSVFARIIVIIKAEDTDINLDYEQVEAAYNDFMSGIEALIKDSDSDFITMSFTEE